MTDPDSPIFDRRRLTTPVAIVILAAGLAACQVGPDFRAPAAPAVSGYTASPLPEGTAGVDVPGGTAQRFAPDDEVAGR